MMFPPFFYRKFLLVQNKCLSLPYVKQINFTIMDKKYKELDKTSYEFVQVSKKLGDDATELLKMVLDKCHNNEIELDFEHSVSVCYDGGNHPEYASNCFSNVECVYLQDGEIYYDCEDCSRLTFKYLTADEMYNIADNVYLQYKADYEETND